MGGLARCHLPNGMVMWLCEEHRNADPRISKVSEDVVQPGGNEMLSINPDQLPQSAFPLYFYILSHVIIIRKVV